MKSLARFWSGTRLTTPRRANQSATLNNYELMEPRAMMSATDVVGNHSHLVGPIAPIDDAPPIVARIVNGTVTNQFPSVGLIGDSSGHFCSGTLIASQYVLTAGHCAVGVGNTAGRFTIGNTTYSTSQVFVHPGYNDNLIGSDNANDIAIYKLNREVIGIAPSPIYRATPAVGQLLTLVGFGAGGTGNGGHDGSFGTKRVGTTPIDQVTSKLIHWTFDNNSESNTAPGDSGGPAFVSIGGTYFVAGVTSGGDSANAGIGDHSFDTRVDVFASWIDSVVGTITSQTTVSIRAVDASAAETIISQPVNSASFLLTRTGATTAPLTVNISTGGTATKGVDYLALPTSVTIPAGASSVTIVMTPKDDALSEGPETAIVSLLAGTGYKIDTSAGSANLSIADNDQVLSNNMFANRWSITGANATVTGSSMGATRETGEPNTSGVSGGKSVWWSWTPQVSGAVTISTTGSNFDTTLGVYRGSAVSSLTHVRSNDDENLWGGVYTSKVTFDAVAGQAYQILVDGYEGESGFVRLSVTQPSGRSANRGDLLPAAWLPASDFGNDQGSFQSQSSMSFDWRNDRPVHLDSQRLSFGNRQNLSQTSSRRFDDWRTRATDSRRDQVVIGCFEQAFAD